MTNPHVDQIALPDGRHMRAYVVEPVVGSVVEPVVGSVVDPVVDLVADPVPEPDPSDIQTGERDRLPAVIVIHDMLGFTEDIQRITRRVADGDQRILAVAPDLYDGLGPKPVCVAKTIRSLRRGEGVTFERLRAVQRWLAQRDDVDPNRIGVVGFCLGGGFALMYAANAPVTVAAPFYGDVPMEADALSNVCPVIGGFGERDKLFAPQGRRLIDHLEKLGVEHDVVMYPDVGHSYMNELTGLGKLARFSPLRAAYDADASEDSWRRLFAFFQKYL